MVQLLLDLHLFPLGIVKTFMSRMRGGSANIPGIGAVVLPDIKTCLLKEIFYLIPVGQSPFTAKTGGIAKKGSPRLPRFRINNVILIADVPATEQRISSQ